MKWEWKEIQTDLTLVLIICHPYADHFTNLYFSLNEYLKAGLAYLPANTYSAGPVAENGRNGRKREKWQKMAEKR